MNRVAPLFQLFGILALVLACEPTAFEPAGPQPDSETSTAPGPRAGEPELMTTADLERIGTPTGAPDVMSTIDAITVTRDPADVNAPPRVNPADTQQPPADPQDSPACVPRSAAQCADIAPLLGAPTYPIVLIHGYGGFAETKISGTGYFYQVVDHLRSSGYSAYAPALDPYNSSVVRGKQLAAYLDRLLACTCAKKVNLVGHSQGGIDGRYVISALGYADRVASLTTLSTPHYGNPLCDYTLSWTPELADPLINVWAWFGGNINGNVLEWPDFRAAMVQGSTEFMLTFNQQFPNSPDVAYYSWAGLGGLVSFTSPCQGAVHPVPTFRTPLNAVLSSSFAYLRGLTGIANDGLVPVERTKWGTFMGCVPADHLQMVGQLLGATYLFDYLAFYRGIAQQLISDGY